ncbi:MAG: aldehyde dehydrogenase (NADP(+)), partial [Saprospiraceae bacterium]
IAAEIEHLGIDLIHTAMEESNLPEGRLTGERGRTCGQLRLFAKHVLEGSWMDAVIDKAMPDRKPFPRSDIRRMNRPVGPVVVFGASNFPLAFSTAGGDTASALAAGCPVVIKGHPAHPKTSEMVFGAMQKAAADCGLPEGVVQHVSGSEFALGQALVQHPATQGVGFTGSFVGGQALMRYAQERDQPIPVFAEMGSVNPVIFLPDTLAENGDQLAASYAGSITLGVGQFCTNPGLLLAVESPELDHFQQALAAALAEKGLERMLHLGIQENYQKRLKAVLKAKGVTTVHEPVEEVDVLEAPSALATVPADVFLDNPHLHEEIFGPFSLLVRCENIEQLSKVWQAVGGQLTTTIMGTDTDLEQHADLLDIAEQVAGRVIFNGVPTGVEVCDAMIHGGPWPSTTDSRFTSVGTSAIQRWLRPVCYQDCPDALLPNALKEANPLGIWRKVNGEFTK